MTRVVVVEAEMIINISLNVFSSSGTLLFAGLTLPLVTTEEGDKFGKSAGNALWLDAEKTSPFSLYQYFIRTKDSDVERLLKLFSFYSLGEIKDIMFKHQQHPDQRYPQMCLAEQLTKLVHGGNVTTAL